MPDGGYSLSCTLNEDNWGGLAEWDVLDPPSAQNFLARALLYGTPCSVFLGVPLLLANPNKCILTFIPYLVRSHSHVIPILIPKGP